MELQLVIIFTMYFNFKDDLHVKGMKNSGILGN